MALTTDFAFEGFRIIRQRPMLILYWGGAGLLLAGIQHYLALTFMSDAMDQLNALSLEAQPDPMAVFGLMGQIMPLYVVMIVLSLVFYAVLNCAVYRAVDNDPKAGFGYLRLGPDEVRQALVMVAFYIVFLIAYLIIVLGVALVGSLLSAGLSLLHPLLGGIAAFVTAICALAAIVWFMVRMSLYSVQTFHDRKFNLFGTWALTKGNVWSLVAGYFITLVMAMLVYLLFGLIYLGVTAVMGLNPLGFLGEMMSVTHQPMPTRDMYSHPVMIGFTLAGGLVLSPLIIALVAGAPAAAYKALVNKGEGA